MPQNDKIKIKQSEIDELYDIEDDTKEVPKVDEQKVLGTEYDDMINSSDEKVSEEFFKKNSNKIDEYVI